jgi:hypothetical protein
LTIDNYLCAAANIIKQACIQVHNPTNNLQWHDLLIDMTTGKHDSQISSILAEVKHWEKMPHRCKPLTVNMVSYQQLQCTTNKSHSKALAMYDWEVFGIYASNCLTEWAQRNGTDIVLNINESPKAFLISDIEFFGKNQHCCSLQFALQQPHLIHTTTVTWCFQKNGKNGEKKHLFVLLTTKFSAQSPHSLLHITQHWVDLKLPLVHSLVVFTADSKTTGSVQFICESNINAALQSVAKNVYNITKQEELSHFTSHSICIGACIGACIALHAAGINSLNIKHAPHWKSDSFLTYLQNLPCQAQCTSRAVTEFNPN